MKLKTFLLFYSGSVITLVAFIVSIGLVIASMIIPPPGVIDGSVLTAIGEIGIFTTLCRIPDMIREIKHGKSLEIHRGDTTVKIESEDDN